MTVGLGLASATALISYHHQNVSLGEDMRAVYRIYNLCVTVSEICFDYGYFLYMNSNSPSTEYDELMMKLKKAQEDERLFARQLIDRAGRDELSAVEIKQLALKAHADVKLLGQKLALLSESAKTSRLSKVHKRSAIRLRDLCAANRGVYIKLGQHLAQLDYLLPAEYVSVLRTLLATSPQSSYEAVRRTIFEDFGDYPENIWKVFEKTPIASASLAQVHIAWDEAGNKFAVKEQHEGLRESSEGDMYAITLAIDIVSRLFPKFSYTWLSREMNRNLPLELDFVNEANNLTQCRLMMQDMVSSGDVALPSVHR
jgi:predicted unusual protein kinase regulating ubiquinone biosynthesis (AarF/ABC1/UbiB family)